MRMSLRLKAQTNKQTEFKRELRNGSLRPWKEESMYGQLIRDMPDTINKEKVYEWFRISDLKVETEALICAALWYFGRTHIICYVNFDEIYYELRSIP